VVLSEQRETLPRTARITRTSQPLNRLGPLLVGHFPLLTPRVCPHPKRPESASTGLAPPDLSGTAAHAIEALRPYRIPSADAGKAQAGKIVR
jgi:hypothetical protein